MKEKSDYAEVTTEQFLVAGRRRLSPLKKTKRSTGLTPVYDDLTLEEVRAYYNLDNPKPKMVECPRCGIRWESPDPKRHRFCERCDWTIQHGSAWTGQTFRCFLKL
jgi:ribosomal protein S27AE